MIKSNAVETSKAVKAEKEALLLDSVQLNVIERTTPIQSSVRNHDCMTITRQKIARRVVVSFCHQVWESLKKPEFVECFWYHDSFVLVSATSGYLVAFGSNVRNHDKDTRKCRFYLRSRDVSEALEEKWNLGSEIGCLYSGGKFVKATYQGKPAVVISRTEGDYCRTAVESDGD